MKSIPHPSGPHPLALPKVAIFVPSRSRVQTLLTQRAANSHLRCVSGNWMPSSKRGKEKPINFGEGQRQKSSWGPGDGAESPQYISPKRIYALYNIYVLKILY